MKRFVEALQNMFRIPDLRNRVLFTLALLTVYRIGAHIPTPGINAAVLAEMFQQAQGSVLGIFDLFSGGSFRKLTIFALGIMPYITASIILQLMAVVFPYLERLQKVRRAGALQDHAVYALSDYRLEHHPVVYHRHHVAAFDGQQRPIACV